MADLTQHDKPLRLSTPLGGDTLVIERLEGHESVSTPFELTLDLLSLDANVDAKKLLKEPVTITVVLPTGGERFFHGRVRRFVQLGRSLAGTSYRAEVVPALWFLSLGMDCRVFQAKSVPDIIKSVLKEAGVTDVRDALTGSYSPREYCVQYRESHLDFISRLMEEEGIFYFFEHTKDKHTMVLADASSAVKPGVVTKLRVEAAVAGSRMLVDDDAIAELSVEMGVRSSGKITLMDYNDTTAKRLEGSATGTNAANASKLNQYDYPGGFQAVADGERLARVRIEEAESLTQVVTGATSCRAVASGQKLEVTNHYRHDVNAAYQILSAQHVAEQGTYRSGEADGSFSFATQFRAIPHAVPFRPSRSTPRSIVHGTQTAVVVGPKGEEIFVDKYGRVKVQFYWDHLGKNDDKSSCWVRVSSNWAGKQWGFIQIPRIGQEVVVDFLEGDPDRPMIVGRVYNGEQMPPYDLPANMTQSGVKTRSSKGGAAADFNEIRFEDKKGSEQLFVHAQKDYVVEVEHDRMLTVDNDETIVITGKRTETVTKDETITYKEGDQSVTLEKGDQSLVISKGKQEITVEGDRSITVKTGNVETTVGMGNVSTTVKMGNVDTKLKMGDMKTQLNLGKISYEAMQEIELKVGQNSIKIDQMGVTIKAMVVKIEGSVSTDIKGLMTTVKGDAMLTVKGGITMIN